MYTMRILHAPEDGKEANDSTYYLEAWRTTHTVDFPNGFDVGTPVITDENDSYEEVAIKTSNLNTTSFPIDRPIDYAQDDEWDNDGGDGTGGWTSDLSDLTTLGGGRYGKQFVAVGHRKIYFGEL